MIFNHYTMKLFTLHLIAAAALVYQIVHGDLQDWIITAGVYTVIAISLTVTYHRYLAHRGFEFRSDLVRRICTAICTIGSGFSSPVVWVAIHREHHRFSDTPNDPHQGSRIQNLVKLHFTSMFIAPKIKYSADMLRDSWYVFLHDHYFKLHIIWASILAIINPALVIAAYLVPLCLLWHAGNLVNSISHYWGYRNHATSDNSKNNWIVALVFFGEWHNNHHNSPRSAKHGEKWWEIDIAYWVIRLLGKNIHVV